MTTINRHAIVSHSAEEMYQLVADIKTYPEFLPWCAATTILKSSDDEIEAKIVIAYKGINKSFSTRNVLVPAKSMEMHLLDGPFDDLQGLWRFDVLDQSACKVSLNLEFEFSSKIIAMTMGRVFNEIAGSLVDSFCQRANSIYGEEKAG